jgi:serine/threonine-protein kinase
METSTTAARAALTRLAAAITVRHVIGGNPLARGSNEPLPRKLGKYTLVRKLASGGMADVFLAIQRSVGGFEKLVVVKRILRSLEHDYAYVDMLLHEARVAATLSHPNIVQVFDVVSVDGEYFIAMEHVHGEDLRTVVRQMKSRHLPEFPLEHALSVVLGVCAGLAYAHEKRDLDGRALHIVHRDVSPQNVVVTFSGGVKLVDFGIAKSDVSGAEETTDNDSDIGRLKGKIPYMSPEQARGEGVDWRSDIFSAGVMLFELTTGRRLFKGPSELETLKLISDGPYPLPSEVHPGYPPALEGIVTRALARDRSERWQSAREMQAALEEFVRLERLPASPVTLSGLMRALFEDKLQEHAEALQEGKRLADAIHSEGTDAEGDVTRPEVGSQVVSVGPTAVAAQIHGPGSRSRAGLLVGLLGVAAAAGTALGTSAWMDHATSTREHEHALEAAPPPADTVPAATATETPATATPSPVDGGVTSP